MPLETMGRWKLRSFASAAFGFSWSACWTRCFWQWLGFLFASSSRTRPGPDHPQNQRVGPCLPPFKAFANGVFVPARSVVRQRSGGVSSAAVKCLAKQSERIIRVTDNGDRSHFHNYSILYYYVSLLLLYFYFIFFIGL